MNGAPGRTVVISKVSASSPGGAVIIFASPKANGALFRYPCRHFLST